MRRSKSDIHLVIRRYLEARSWRNYLTTKALGADIENSEANIFSAIPSCLAWHSRLHQKLTLLLGESASRQGIGPIANPTERR